MAPEFAGRIKLDIRDSVPDWAPYLAPKAQAGAPNVLFIVWDDVGYGTMDCFGGPVHTPTMTRIADLLLVTGTSTTPYTAPFTFKGGTIDKVVVDVSGGRYRDHEAEVRGWFILD